MGAGGKGGSGVYQAIINELPEHDVYVELFAGYGGVLRRKRSSAGGSVAVDLDRECCDYLARLAMPGLAVYEAEAVRWMSEREVDARTLVYADPPYLASVRADGGKGGPIYRHEMRSEGSHRNLLGVLRQAGCDVAISHPMCDLYDRELAGWRRVSYSEPTRGGGSVCTLWMNYGKPDRLHDARYAGGDYRARENLARRIGRWRRRVAAMAPAERQALLEALLLSPAARSVVDRQERR